MLPLVSDMLASRYVLTLIRDVGHLIQLIALMPTSPTG